MSDFLFLSVMNIYIKLETIFTLYVLSNKDKWLSMEFISFNITLAAEFFYFFRCH